MQPRTLHRRGRSVGSIAWGTLEMQALLVQPPTACQTNEPTGLVEERGFSLQRLVISPEVKDMHICDSKTVILGQ